LSKVVPLNAADQNFAYPVGAFRVFRITPNDPESFVYLPQLVIRALQFIEKYEAETDPVWLTQLLYNNLRQNPQLVFILVAVDGEQIVAHSISYVDTFQKLGAVAIHIQMEFNRSVLAEDKNKIRQLGRTLMEDWTRSLKLKTILAYTTDDIRARLHRRDGYRPFRVMVRKDLED